MKDVHCQAAALKMFYMSQSVSQNKKLQLVH